MPSTLCAALLAKIHEQIERTVHLIGLLPAESLHWTPPDGGWPPAVLFGHLLDCLAGFCAVLASANPERLEHFGQLREMPVNHTCDAAEALGRIAVYQAHIDEGFALLTDTGLARRLPTVFVKEGEPVLTLLLGNLEHLINHKHQLFTCLKLLGAGVGTPDLYRFRGGFTLRKAVLADVPAIHSLIDASVRGLQAGDYTPDQIEQSLRSVYGADSQLIADGTYFAVEAGTAIVGCGGWSRRKTLYGGDRFKGREDSLLDPATAAARIRAFFVHPSWARRGFGSLILEACESAAIAAGFKRFELGATLTGVAFYQARGYTRGERLSVPLPNAEPLAVVRMEKTIRP
jgi:GNAT superfamily N-acetyltransferase